MTPAAGQGREATTNAMQINPKFPKLWRNKYPGVVQSRARSGFFLRAAAVAVNTRSIPQLNWRGVFGNTRAGFIALAYNSPEPDPATGLTAQAAWQLENSQTFNQLQQPFEGQLGDNLTTGKLLGVTLGPRTASVTNETAYYTQVQTTLASLNLPPRGAPQFNTSYLSTTTTSTNQTLGSYTAILDIPTQPGPYPLTLTVSLEVTIAGSNTTTWDVSAGTPPPGVTATLSAPTLTLTPNAFGTESVGFAELTLTLAPNTAPFTGSITATITGPGGTATFTINITATTGDMVAVTPTPTFGIPKKLACVTAYDSDLNVTGFTLTYDLIDTTNPAMWRTSPSGATPADGGATAIQPQWQVNASAAYTDIYSPPDPSTWIPITYNGQVHNNSGFSYQGWQTGATAILAAWETEYGALPDNGYIKFQVIPIDPLTGIPGPALSCTASFAAGTFRGGAQRNWTGYGWSLDAAAPVPTVESVTGSGPYTANFAAPVTGLITATSVTFYNASTGAAIAAACPVVSATTTSVTFTLPSGASTPTAGNALEIIQQQATETQPAQWESTITIAPLLDTETDTWPGGYNFPRTFTPTIVPASAIPNGANQTKNSLPPGVTITFTPTSVTFDSDTSPAQTLTMLISADNTAPSAPYVGTPGIPANSWVEELETTDGVFEIFLEIGIPVYNPAVLAPPTNYLSVDQDNYYPGITGPGTYTFPITISNTGPDPIPVSMVSQTQSQYSATAQALLSTPYSITFDNANPEIPAASGSTPGSVTIHCTITVPESIDTAEVQIQLAALAGNNTVLVAVQPGTDPS